MAFCLDFSRCFHTPLIRADVDIEAMSSHRINVERMCRRVALRSGPRIGSMADFHVKIDYSRSEQQLALRL
jgi:hypothetical protein